VIFSQITFRSHSLSLSPLRIESLDSHFVASCFLFRLLSVVTGEEGEETRHQVRAKLHVIEDKNGTWKERGTGLCKLNINTSTKVPRLSEYPPSFPSLSFFLPRPSRLAKLPPLHSSHASRRSLPAHPQRRSLPGNVVRTAGQVRSIDRVRKWNDPSGRSSGESIPFLPPSLLLPSLIFILSHSSPLLLLSSEQSRELRISFVPFLSLYASSLASLSSS